jgi:hypothetical protein
LKQQPQPKAITVGLIGSIGAIVVLLALLFLGHKYKDDCLAAGKDFEQCWEKGLTIAGMNAGGPLSAAVILGYIVGQFGKEKEKAEKYQEGYWKYNPELRRGGDSEPSEAPSSPRNSNDGL